MLDGRLLTYHLMTLRWPMLNHFFSNLLTGRLWHIYSGVSRLDLLVSRALFFFFLHRRKALLRSAQSYRGEKFAFVLRLRYYTIACYSSVLLSFEPHTRPRLQS
ncbi:hypothetical protein BDW72DRAFT_174195 [Aspergillus terricola var. indicus]